ncbi:GNAT family N-acetyltransferase [Enterobacter hormaechei]|uniref:GNAT family N-acetyltransferase n=1 Tax=Enterobacter hormaechei TaxID=158836 RepID=UPI00263AFF05|nr:GNAT family N-acetyltransferase [Enterobacter hormaechei]MDN5006975.1 GNAT family N-acetyltransferase [Enterobacter hormaechei]MDO1523449.1 GNAT family N-acetyltransferase [Enterobacter hormaechei]
MLKFFILVDTVPPPEDFYRLRVISGLTPRPFELVKRALSRSCYGVHITYQGRVVGMGRIVGDGVMNFEIVDIAVDPKFQGKGLGRAIMQNIIGWFEKNVDAGAYISLVADVPQLYTKFGFEYVRPKGEGMARIWQGKIKK